MKPLSAPYVIPVKTGIQSFLTWTPASAGVTTSLIALDTGFHAILEKELQGDKI